MLFTANCNSMTDMDPSSQTLTETHVVGECWSKPELCEQIRGKLLLRFTQAFSFGGGAGITFKRSFSSLEVLEVGDRPSPLELSFSKDFSLSLLCVAEKAKAVDRTVQCREKNKSSQNLRVGRNPQSHLVNPLSVTENQPTASPAETRSCILLTFSSKGSTSLHLLHMQISTKANQKTSMAHALHFTITAVVIPSMFHVQVPLHHSEGQYS